MARPSSPHATRAWNREAWNRRVDEGDMWTRPVGAAQIEAARRGEWSVVLTGLEPVPRDWFPPELRGVDVLCLASGGGQQGPILAAAGAVVTVLDNSPRQLEQDRGVSDAHDLGIRTVEGDMADLAPFADASFDLVFHPVSNLFVPDVRPVWREAFRVLRSGGELLAGFGSPASFIFDHSAFERSGAVEVRYRLPYADERDLPDDELAALRARGEPMEFGHTLTDQIGGQLDAGFRLVGLYETWRSEQEWPSPADAFMPAYVATRARKP